MNQKLATIILCLTIFLALFLRIYRLGTIPNGFFFDEATISYQAYSVLLTGHDTWGVHLPLLSFNDYGEYILPLGVYGQMLAVYFGGLTVLAARLPGAILGTISVFLVYLLGKKLFSLKVGLLSALFLAIQPLSLGWSRFVFEGNFGTVFFLAGLIFLADYLTNQKHLTIAGFFFGASMLTYHVFLVTTPLFLGITFLFYRNHFTPPKKILAPLVFFAIFFCWAILAIYSGSGRARFSQAQGLLSIESLNVLNQTVGYCQKDLASPLCRATFNKGTLVVGTYLENYFAHFSPQFLAFDGTFLRRNVLPRTGLILWPELVLLLFSLIYLASHKQLQTKLLLALVIIYPFANSFTGVGEISRIAFWSPYLALFSGIGLAQLPTRQACLFVLVIVGAFYMFSVNYFVLFPKTGAYYTNFGYDRLFNQVKTLQNNYNKIFISRHYNGSVPYISALFFLPVDPNLFVVPGKIDRHPDNKGYYIIKSIGNIYFFDDINTILSSKNSLVIATPEELPKTEKSLFDIIDPTGRKLFVGFASENNAEK